jgi:uncharacterized protein YcbK (DUF882 family)
MAKRPTEKQCMDFANALLRNQRQVDALREAGLATGNDNYDYVKASRMVRFDKVQEILAECEAVAMKKLNITQTSIITQLLALLEDPDITVKDKRQIWMDVAQLSGLNKIISENTNHDELNITPELAEVLLVIKARKEQERNDGS